MQHTFMGIPKFQLCKNKEAYMNHLIVKNCHMATNLNGNSKTLIKVNKSNWPTYIQNVHMYRLQMNSD